MKLIFRSCLFAFLLLVVLAASKTQQAADVKPEDRFAKFDKMKVHYQNYGKGDEAVIFVHGWTCNLNFWKANIPAFIDQTRVIAIDLPGHGQSEKPEIAYTMKLFALAVEAVMRDAKVTKATLVGHSMGAPVLWQFYRNFPEKNARVSNCRWRVESNGNARIHETFPGPTAVARLPCQC